MWARGAVVVNCVLGYVMLIGGGAAAGFSPLGVSLFWVGCIQDRELGTLALPSEVYPAGNLQ